MQCLKAAHSINAAEKFFSRKGITCYFEKKSIYEPIYEFTLVLIYFRSFFVRHSAASGLPLSIRVYIQDCSVTYWKSPRVEIGKCRIQCSSSTVNGFVTAPIFFMYDQLKAFQIHMKFAFYSSLDSVFLFWIMRYEAAFQLRVQVDSCGLARVLLFLFILPCLTSYSCSLSPHYLLS